MGTKKHKNTVALKNDLDDSIGAQLEFLCYIDIINIEYADPTLYPSYFDRNMISMNKYAKCQWNIYDDILSDFRSSVCGKYFIKNINLNWMLECSPNGQSLEDEGNVNVLLSLLRLPNKIKSVTVHMILNCDYNDIKWEFHLRFDYENNSYGWPEYTLLSSYLTETTSITFTVQMTILEIYDKNDRKIPRLQWNGYGIIDNHEELEKEFDLEFKQRHKRRLELREERKKMERKQSKQEIKQIDTTQIISDKIHKLPPKRNMPKVKVLGFFQPQQGMSKTELFVGLLMAASHVLNLS